MRIIKTFLLSLLVISSTVKANDAILGFWLSESGRAVVQVYKEGDKFNGKIVWLFVEHSGEKEVVLDLKNPDESKRSQKIKGLNMLSGFTFDDDEYSGGKIYDPTSGKTYKAYMELQGPNKVKLRGYVGISLFGKTSYWTRQKAATPDKYSKK